MILSNLLSTASFMPRSLQSPNAWVGHLPFAAWIIQQVSPKIFVELGTHSGNSYFSFCQAVEEAGISSKCYAVDTWTGDEHSGGYTNDIFVKVNAHHQEYYSRFSRLLRMTFDDAVTYFDDASIELLHIDGLHSYEAVKHDFETWLPKLAPGAVVMFHDTNVRQGNFGVWKLWGELQKRYPNNLEFVHSNGLGVMQLNNAPVNKQLEYLNPASIEKEGLINYFSALGGRQLERFDAIESKLQAVFANQAIADRGTHILGLEQTINNQATHIGNVEAAIVERDAHVHGLEQTITNQATHISNVEAELAKRGAHISGLEQTIAGLEQTIANQVSHISSIEQKLGAFDRRIAELDQSLRDIYSSRSWRITAPLRYVAMKIKGKT